MKSRTEKKVAERLSSKGVICYCPLIYRRRNWSDRIKMVQEPLFSSYVFVQADPSNELDILQTPGVVRFLYWLKRPAIVRDDEIDQIRHFLSEFDHTNIVKRSFTTDDIVRIKSGPLMDYSGEVKGVHNHKMKVFLHELSCVIEVDLRRNIIEKA